MLSDYDDVHLNYSSHASTSIQHQATKNGLRGMLTDVSCNAYKLDSAHQCFSHSIRACSLHDVKTLNSKQHGVVQVELALARFLLGKRYKIYGLRAWEKEVDANCLHCFCFAFLPGFFAGKLHVLRVLYCVSPLCLWTRAGLSFF